MNLSGLLLFGVLFRLSKIKFDKLLLWLLSGLRPLPILPVAELLRRKVGTDALESSSLLLLKFPTESRLDFFLGFDNELDRFLSTFLLKALS